MDPITWNIAAYSAQVAAVVFLAGAATSLLRIDVAEARYGFWRAVMVLSLLLPLVQGRQATAPASTTSSVVETTATAVIAAIPRQSAPAFDWSTLVLGILAAGIAVRFLWIAISLVRLARLRRAGERAQDTALLEELQ